MIFCIVVSLSLPKAKVDSLVSVGALSPSILVAAPDVGAAGTVGVDPAGSTLVESPVDADAAASAAGVRLTGAGVGVSFALEIINIMDAPSLSLHSSKVLSSCNTLPE